MDTKYCDEHTLYVICNGATAAQVHDCFKQAISACAAFVPPGNKCDFRVNYVCNREGKSFDLAYVFVTNPLVYRILTGSNPNGSPRTVRIPDASWQPPPEGEYFPGKTSLPKLEISPSITCWAAQAEEEDRLEAIRQKELTLRTRPFHEVQEAPLVTCPPFLTSAGETHSLCVQKSFASNPPSHQLPNVLLLRKVPKFVTAARLKQCFAPYVSSQCANFPLVSKDRGSFTVAFSAHGHDALFAMQMMMKFNYVQDGQSALLFCSFASREK